MLDHPGATRLLTCYGQQHVLRWFDTLGVAQKERLLTQIEQLDLDWLQRALASQNGSTVPRRILPFPDTIHRDDPRVMQAREAGAAALRQGRVGTLLLAGGQGTRLGFDGAKGSFPLGAVSRRTLYQIHAERLVALGRRHGAVPPLYLMTSDANHEATCALFSEHQNFGLPVERVIIFRQALAPAVDTCGKLLMDAPDHIVMTPNGNGGVFVAMRESGVFDHMRELGVDTLSYIQVDNALSPSCDPLFVGHHLLHASQFSCKAIDRRSAGEKVGCYAMVDGRLRIVEYNELPDELARRTDETGRLLFGHGNPGLFMWSASFAAAQAARVDLPVHRALKKIPHLDDRGQMVTPDAPCGFKFESFAMDTLPDAERSLVLWCDRDAEFAPVKNASGDDSPDSARRLMTRLYGSWIRRAGGRITNSTARIEISPLYALDADEIASRLPDRFEVNEDLFLT